MNLKLSSDMLRCIYCQGDWQTLLFAKNVKLLYPDIDQIVLIETTILDDGMPIGLLFSLKGGHLHAFCRCLTGNCRPFGNGIIRAAIDFRVRLRSKHMLRCKKCHSTNVKKNGVTTAGRQKYHCKSCGIYTTTNDAARERAAKEALAEQMLLECVSQRGIARVTGMSRSTIIKRLKKPPFEPIGVTITPTIERPILDMD